MHEDTTEALEKATAELMQKLEDASEGINALEKQAEEIVV